VLLKEPSHSSLGNGARLLDPWLKQLGFDAFPDRLIRRGQAVARDRPYANELRALLDPKGEVRAAAVFEVAGVPAVCLIEGDPASLTPDAMQAIQSRVWNQGLVSVVLLLGDDALRALPAIPGVEPSAIQKRDKLSAKSPYTAYGVESAALLEAHPDWFSASGRVDQHLLENLKHAVKKLQPHVGSQKDTQYLLAQVLFVSYLEHRGIVDDTYREKFKVGRFTDLIALRNGQGLDRLFMRLKKDFNGDFLSPESINWRQLDEAAFSVLDRFLARTHLEGGQTSFWAYDFRYIPVELLSGIYESFIGDKAAALGAYYTPRHLANLAVDEALGGLADDTDPVIFDGACGSGILLTTAFRRLLGRAETQLRRPMTLGERGKLLQRTIFGADINESACRVTAFSLYLALLEDLVPRDIAQLLDEHHDKLPSLTNQNIFPGDGGDMFHLRHPITTGRMPRPTIMLSNPPWKEAPGDSKPTFEKWLRSPEAKSSDISVPLRQIAIAFVYRATALAAPGARLCLILPASAFVKPTSRVFLKDWLSQVKLSRLINFADMRSLLFKASHPCVVVSAHTLAKDAQVEAHAAFEYLTPKAELSLAYRRLTLHASDRRVLQQYRIRQDPSILQMLYWGSEYELGIIDTLRGRGTIEDIINQKRFASGKGFHEQDGEKSAPLKPFKDHLFLDAKVFPSHGPVLEDGCLRMFDLKQIAGHGDMRLYDGARVVFTDGMTSRRRIRACVSETFFSFTNSIGCVRDLEDDAELMRFLAAYLSSDLASYLALLTAPTAVLERTQIKLTEVEKLPFWLPERHPSPAKARALVAKVAAKVQALEADASKWLRSPSTGLPRLLEGWVREYFGIDERMSHIIDETMSQVVESVQPSTMSNFPTPLQRAPSKDQLTTYAQTFSSELERYKHKQGGEGVLHTTVKTCAWGGVAYGVVTATAGRARTVNEDVFDEAVARLLQTLDRHQLLQVRQGVVSGVADVVIRHGDTLAFAKPLIGRLWLTSAALDDALRLVRYVAAGHA
jgi:hypothetical protein